MTTDQKINIPVASFFIITNNIYLFNGIAFLVHYFGLVWRNFSNRCSAVNGYDFTLLLRYFSSL